MKEHVQLEKHGRMCLQELTQHMLWRNAVIKEFVIEAVALAPASLVLQVDRCGVFLEQAPLKFESFEVFYASLTFVTIVLLQ